MESFKTAFNLYYPFIISVIFIITGIRTKKIEGDHKITLGVAGIFNIGIPIKNIVLIRFLLFGFAFGFPILNFLFRDYSDFFPKNYKMDVYYDEKGILESLKEYDSSEIRNLNIQVDFPKRDSLYFCELDKQVKKEKICNSFFSLKNAFKYSEGTTSFVIEKESGFQSYYILESKGIVSHYMDTKLQPEIKFESYFEKQNSPADFLQPNGIGFVFHGMILHPEFKQTLNEYISSTKIMFHHILVGITRVRIFPFPKISNTIYAFEYNNELIPIGYAIYRE